ncbi:CRISPR-associated RAMP protein [Sulfodiicoccus acidiphilus]|uniref:CRISPR-associated RAMP protein n=1 Tax=Sulfodiicoccus acidiphilus TaxID=1670455 RepID=A0A348B5C2_9CREN|nr:CRISPR-associated RAMP protein Csx7 [Sulfodiicoccus acidiphilus]BBD73374.1 CRISPR-associated RAMP protein [Sulfodiicoccus acidiphilus]GGU00987.1 CRISPR-associated RAMP protein [Sulfodiicoccus acidiphilus]
MNLKYVLARKDVLRRTVRFSATLVADSPVAVGTGEKGSPKEVMKDARGRPVIPGSSWKGVFRSSGERIARGRGLTVCAGQVRDNCLSNYRKGRDFQELVRRGEVEEALKLFWDHTCLNCKVFGTQSVSAQVAFSDSVSDDATFDFRPMVAISREDGAALGKALVSLEYVQPGAHFNFSLTGTNLPNYALGYLLEVARGLHTHLFQVGGNKSRGFGFVSFQEAVLDVVPHGEGKLEALDEIDKEVRISLPVEGKGDEFFEKVKPIVEVFSNVKLPFPR